MPAQGQAVGAKRSTDGKMQPLLVDGAGALVTAGGASGGTSSTFGAAFPATGTATGFYDGTNMQGARVFDGDTGAGSQWLLGAQLRLEGAGGSVPVSSTNPLRVDPTGATAQPVSGTVTGNQGTAAAGSGAWPVTVTSTTDTVVKPGDSVNNAVRVNVVAGSAAGTASFEQPGGVDQEARVYDTDTGAGAEWTAGAQLRLEASGGSVPVSVTNPLRVDPTGTTTQPVSGSVAVSGTVTANAGTGPVASSGWFVRLTDGTDTALVSAGGAVLVDGSATTQPVSGTLTAVTSITNTVTTQGASGDNSAAGATSTGTLPGIVETSTTPPTRSDGNRAAQVLDSDGKVYVRDFDYDPLFASSGLSTATTLTQLVAVPGASVSVYLTSWKCSASAASTTTADQQCTIKYGTGTNCGTGTTYADGCFQGANGGCHSPFPNGPLKLPANNALCWIHAAAGSKIVTVTYFLAP